MKLGSISRYFQSLHGMLSETPFGVFEAPMVENDVVALETEKIHKKMPDLFELEDTIYSQIGKSSSAVKVSNRAMRVPLKLKPGGKFGHYNPDNADMGLGGGNVYDKAVVTVAHFKYAIQWSKLTEMVSDSSEKAIKNAYQDLVASHMPEFRRALNTLCVTGGNGVVATVTSVSTSGGVDTVTCTTDGFGVKLLREGQPINVYDSTLATNRTAAGEVEIIAVDIANKTFTAPATAGITGGDKILIGGLSGASPTSLYGIPYHNSNASTGSWLGMDRATIYQIRSNRVNASGNLALPHPRLAINKIGDRLGKKQMKKGLKAFMHPCQKFAYEALGQLVSVIQKTAKEEGLDLYFGDGMQMAGAPIDDQFIWDKTRIDFLPMDTFGRAEMSPAGYYEVGGRKIFEVRGPSGGVQTSNLQYLTVSFQIFNEQPPAMSYIDGLTVPSGY